MPLLVFVKLLGEEDCTSWRSWLAQGFRAGGGDVVAGGGSTVESEERPRVWVSKVKGIRILRMNLGIEIFKL